MEHFHSLSNSLEVPPKTKMFDSFRKEPETFANPNVIQKQNSLSINSVSINESLKETSVGAIKKQLMIISPASKHQKQSYDFTLNSCENNEVPSPSSGQTKFNEGRWTKEEHFKFIEGLIKFGNNWKSVQKNIITRSSTQARSHAQKFFMSCKKIINQKNTKEENRKAISELFDEVICNIISNENKNSKSNEGNTNLKCSVNDYYAKIENLILSNESKIESKNISCSSNRKNSVMEKNDDSLIKLNDSKNELDLNSTCNFNNSSISVNNMNIENNINSDNLISSNLVSKNKYCRKMSSYSSYTKKSTNSSKLVDINKKMNNLNEKGPIFSISKISKKQMACSIFSDFPNNVNSIHTQTSFDDINNNINNRSQVINIVNINVFKDGYDGNERKNPFDIDFNCFDDNKNLNNNSNNLFTNIDKINMCQVFNKFEVDDKSDICMNDYMKIDSDF